MANLYRRGVSRLRAILLFTLLAVSISSFLYGPLFPWSPIKPGYSHQSFARADLYFRDSFDPAYLKTDSIVAELEETLGLKLAKRVTIVALADWSDYEHLCPWTRGRGVAGVTLETGTVMFITPRIQERRLDTVEFLRHELTHAITHQNMSLYRTQQMKRLHWLVEGVPVWFGKQKAYVTPEEFRKQAKTTDLRPVIDPNGPWPAQDIRFSYVAWKEFIEYLIAQGGLEKFRDFYHRIIAAPGEHDAIFRACYGQTLADAVHAFQRRLSER